MIDHQYHMKLKTGKEEIVCLLTKVIEKYERETGQKTIRNSNRKNYEGIARTLSDISNELPHTADTLQHEHYPPDHNPKKLDYPFRKYDITGNQVKDAYFNQIVAKPRNFLVDACYIYLYEVGRKGFETAPRDPQLIQEEGAATLPAQAVDALPAMIDVKTGAFTKKLWVALAIMTCAFMVVLLLLIDEKKDWDTIRKDMKILPYQPTRQEIDSLEGIWLCYTGSPQARSSDDNRYHLVVTNVVDVKYKDGYFTFNRYGASFDHLGYMQFEAPYLVSIHSYIKNNTDSIESPRHSLMQLDGREHPYVSVISASWNFDVGSRNNIIGIREVYIKQGKGGQIKEVMNTVENAGCHCKIVQWQQENKTVKSFYLHNQLLDTISEKPLKKLLDERSILLRVPDAGLIIRDTAALGNTDINFP